MAQSKLEKAESDLANLRSRIGVEKKEATGRGESLVTSLATGYAMGYVEKKKMTLPKIKGVDQKLQYGFGALALSMTKMGSKKTRRLVGNAGETLLGIVSYEVGKRGYKELTIEGSEAEEEVVETGAI